MIGTGTLTKQIAGYLARTGFDALDADALRATKEHILYTLGTILAGSSAPGAKQVRAGAMALSGASGESSVLVTGEKLPAAAAALVNATMGHSRELDINDDRIAYKSSVTVVPAPGALCTPTRPPCNSTMRCTMARPSPLPPSARASAAWPPRK